MAKRRADATNHKPGEKTTVAQYHEMERKQDVSGISKFLQQRFTERYIERVTTDQEDTDSQ